MRPTRWPLIRPSQQLEILLLKNNNNKLLTLPKLIIVETLLSDIRSQASNPQQELDLPSLLLLHKKVKIRGLDMRLTHKIWQRSGTFNKM